MPNPIMDMNGFVSGRLTVISRGKVIKGQRGTKIYWKCICSCGNEVEIRSDGLRNGDYVSCGCKKLDQLTTHGRTKTKEHKTCLAMRERCLNRSHRQYADYGGRGITICDRWSDFKNFLVDMGPRPSLKHSIERLNNDGGYCPDNCIWADKKTQARNRRNTVANAAMVVEIRNLSKTMKQVEIARKFKIKVATVHGIVSGRTWQ